MLKNKKYILINKNQKTPLLKFKIKGKKNSSGRNNQGCITSFHKGGGHKRSYRAIDFKRTYQSKGIVCSIEYDPNRNASIASVYSIYQKIFFIC